MSGIIPPELRATLDSHLHTSGIPAAPTDPFVHDPDETPYSPFLCEAKIPLIVLLEFYDRVFPRKKKKMVLYVRGNNSKQLTPVLEI